MTAWEMERMVGSTIFNEFYPDRYYNHDAEDDENLITLGETRHDEPLRVNKRAIESDILIYRQHQSRADGRRA
jgi:nickel-dependent lactate racemase